MCWPTSGIWPYEAEMREKLARQIPHPGRIAVHVQDHPKDLCDIRGLYLVIDTNPALLGPQTLELLNSPRPESLGLRSAFHLTKSSPSRQKAGFA